MGEIGVEAGGAPPAGGAGWPAGGVGAGPAGRRPAE